MTLYQLTWKSMNQQLDISLLAHKQLQKLITLFSQYASVNQRWQCLEDILVFNKAIQQKNLDASLPQLLLDLKSKISSCLVFMLKEADQKNSR